MRLRRPRSDVSLLRASRLFDGYSRRQLAPLVPHTDRLAVVPGAGLARAGRRPHQVVVLVAGEAVVRRSGVEVCRLGPGAAIGAVEEATATAHEHDVVAATPVSALVIEGRAFRWAAQVLPGFTGRFAGPCSSPSRPLARTAVPLGSAA
jgi:CRP/FNR family cyclic AMP-dependent transcriptional regulator